MSQIADIVGVSVRTIHQRMSKFGLFIRAQYSDLNDNQLDCLISEIQIQFSMCGNRQIRHLRSRGYHIRNSRVREAQRRNDSIDSIVRLVLCVLNRQEYSVPGPRSLYHIDVYHKLIR